MKLLLTVRKQSDTDSANDPPQLAARLIANLREYYALISGGGELHFDVAASKETETKLHLVLVPNTASAETRANLLRLQAVANSIAACLEVE